jgi:hypothetical protein
LRSGPRRSAILVIADELGVTQDPSVEFVDGGRNGRSASD